MCISMNEVSKKGENPSEPLGKNKSDVIGVLSGKGGVGKTTVVSNIGAALSSEFGKKVLIIDSNVKTSNLGLHLGLYEDSQFTLKEVLLKKVPVIQAILLHPKTGVRLLPAPLKGDMELQSMDGIIKELKNVYDPIIIDFAPGLGRDVIVAAKTIDRALLVTTPDLPSLTDVIKTIELLRKFEKEIIGVVVNRVKHEKYELSIEEIKSTCGCDVVSVIPETNKISESIMEGVPLVVNSDCQAAVEFKKLAAVLIGEEYKPPGPWDKLKNIKTMFGIPKGVLEGISKKPKDAFVKDTFVRDVENNKILDEKEKLIKENKEKAVYEKGELVAVEELKKRLKIDLEKEIMEKIKEKLKNRVG